MELESEQYRKLFDALIRAFPRKENLTQMLRFGSNRRLETISTGGNLQDIVFRLLEAAEAEGWIIELIEDARKANPSNSKLERVEKDIKAYRQAKQDDDNVVKDDLEEKDPPIPPCPYKGLAAFRERDKNEFFGREDFTKELIEIVKEQSFVTLVGSSGSGKSSIVLASLKPKMKEQDWLVVNFQPKRDPFHQLVFALTRYADLNIENWCEDLKNETRELSEIIQLIFDEFESERPLLLIVDQFEEIFTLDASTNRELQKSFLAQLVRATQKDLKKFRLFLTIRSDFLSYILDQDQVEFGKAFRQSIVILTAMSREELCAVIEKPAEKKGVRLELELADSILNDVLTHANDRSLAGRLPLLEFALTELWQKQENNTLTHKAYQEIGKVDGALTKHAENVYNHFSEEDQEKIKHIFTQLVNPGLGTEDTRKVSTKTQIGKDNWDLVQKLANERLVTTSLGESAKKEENVEIVHEALIWSWQRLKEWISNRRAFMVWLGNMHLRANQWSSEYRDSSMLLGHREIAKAQEYFESHESEIVNITKEYIKTSIKDRKEEKEETRREEEARIRKEEAKTRRRKKFLSYSGIFVVFLLTLSLIYTLIDSDRDRWMSEPAKIEGYLAKKIILRSLKTEEVREQETEEAKELTNGKLLTITNLKLYGQEEVNPILDDDRLPLGKPKGLLAFYRYLTKTEDIKTLSDLPNLQELSLLDVDVWKMENSPNFTNLAKIRNISNLRKLRLEGVKISDLEFLEELSNVQELYLSKTNVTDLSALSQLRNLQVLSLSYTEVDDLSPLAALPNLQELFLVNTKVSNLQPLINLNLKKLYFGNKEKEDILEVEGTQTIQGFWDKSSGFELFLNGHKIDADDINNDHFPEKEPVKIGIVTFTFEEDKDLDSLDTNQRFIGKPVKDTVEIIMKEAINEGEAFWLKGILKSTRTEFELVFLNEDETTSTRYAEWVDDNDLKAVVGFVLSNHCEKIADIAEEEKVLTILTNCGAPQIFEEKITNPHYLFRTAAHATMDSVSMVRYFERRNIEVDIVSTINPDYSFGKASSRNIQDSLEKLFNIQVFVSVFVQRGVEQHCETIEDIGRFDPQIIVASFSVADLINFINELERCADYIPENTILALSTGEPILPQLKNLLGGNISEIIFGGRGVAGQLTCKSEDDNCEYTPLSNWFEKKFEEKNKGNPDYKIPNYYAYRMAQALFGLSIAYENAFGDSGEPPEIKEVIKALEGLEYESPSGKVVMALANGHQAVQDTAVGMLTIDSNGNYDIEDIEYFDMWCVNPPPHMSSSEWIGSEEFGKAECRSQ